VLTAAHVLEEATDVRVRFQADRPGACTVEATVDWQHAGIDVALLSLAADTVTDITPVSFSRVGEQDAVLRRTAWASRASRSVRTATVHASERCPGQAGRGTPLWRRAPSPRPHSG
jgi:hypothetical protein